MAECHRDECAAEAIMAIRTQAPSGKDGLVTTIYQFAEDAPKTAAPYCGPHGVHLAANLAALTDADLRVTVAIQ